MPKSSKTGYIATVGSEDGEDAILEATSYRTTPNWVQDPYAVSQWYLSTANEITPVTTRVNLSITAAKNDYTGRGVKIGIIDEGFNVDHADLAGRFDISKSYDPRDAINATDIRTPTGSSQHGSWVAGVVGAKAGNGIGIEGVAHDATLVGTVIRFGTGASSRAEVADLVARQVSVDVANISWNYSGAFSDNFSGATFSALGAAVNAVASNGRGGLGTVLVVAAGNDREYVAGDTRKDGDSANYHNLGNARSVVTVGGISEDGRVSSFSAPGANLLVCAPAEAMLTVAGTGNGASEFDYTYVSGTSFAAPVISGVIAMMLEANPLLGYRDVQEILAHSAQRPTTTGATWTVNAGTSWNGGGLWASNDVGFGLIDARAAVRLAETWDMQQTRANEIALSASTGLATPVAIAQNGASTFTIQVAAPAGGLQLQWAELKIDLTHSYVGDLVVELISPSGTHSVLVDRPGAGTNARVNLSFTLSSNQFWGEDAAGTWQVVVRDQGTGGTGQFTNAQLSLYGSAGDDDTIVFTDQFASMGTGTVRIGDGLGRDHLNAAALSTGVVIDLDPGHVSTIAGRHVVTNLASTVDDATGGEANDWLLGNAHDNRLVGGRGVDVLAGRDGNDVLLGGGDMDILYGEAGNDSLAGEAGNDYAFGGIGNDTLDGGDGLDQLYGEDGSDVMRGGAGTDWLYGSTGDDTLSGGTETDVLCGESGADSLSGDSGDDYVYGGIGNDTLDGGDGLDLLYGEDGADVMRGGAGTDWVFGGVGDDTIDGGTERDFLFGDAGNDRIAGGAGEDRIDGGAGDDVVDGGTGTDELYGSDGNDRINGGDDFDWVIGGAGNDTLDGGKGNDVLVCGAGADTVMFRTNQGIDYVYDFSAAQGDKVLVEGLTGVDLTPYTYAYAQGSLLHLGDGSTLIFQDLSLVDLRASLLMA